METAQFTKKVENFTCVVCGTEVKGNGYTNHCPECLSSLHVDINPGDRACECHGVMLAEKLEHKNGHDYIVHKCVKCGHVRRNKTSPNDNFEALLALSHQAMDFYLKNKSHTRKKNTAPK